jgi:hypothetical protein
VFYTLWLMTLGHGHICAEDVASDFQIWAPITLKAELPYNFQSSFQVQTRYNDNASQLSLVILDPSIGYDFNKYVSLELGYANETDYANGADLKENKLHQELWLRKTLGRHHFSLRTRLEEFINVKGTNPVRLRFFLSHLRPIGQSDWHFITENEMFINLNSIANERDAGFEGSRRRDA